MNPVARGATIGLMLLFAGSVAAQSLPQALPEDVGFSADRLTRIGVQIQYAIDEEQIAGAVAMVARDGQVAYFEHFGMADIDDGEAMRTDTLFRLASMTKPITSLAVMMLYEEGHFLLNDPVSRYLLDSYQQLRTTRASCKCCSMAVSLTECGSSDPGRSSS